MIHADERSCFRQAIALNHGVTEAAPKLFLLGGQAAPPEMRAQNFHPKREWILRNRHQRLRNLSSSAASKSTAKFRQPAFRFEIAFELVAQGFDEPRNGHQDRDAFTADRGRDFAGPQRIEEDGRRAEDLRNEDSQHLSEHVTEWEEIQEFQGMKESLVSPVLWRFPFRWVRDWRATLPCVKNDAARFSGGSRGEDNFERVVPRAVQEGRTDARDGGRSLRKLLHHDRSDPTGGG